jgi:hypothetical protein
MRNMLQTDAMHSINARAAQDADFRSRLLTNPNAAIKEVTGAEVKDFKIKFIEKDPDLDALVVLPDLRAKTAVA